MKIIRPAPEHPDWKATVDCHACEAQFEVEEADVCRYGGQYPSDHGRFWWGVKCPTPACGAVVGVGIPYDVAARLRERMGSPLERTL